MPYLFRKSNSHASVSISLGESAVKLAFSSNKSNPRWRKRIGHKSGARAIILTLPLLNFWPAVIKSSHVSRGTVMPASSNTSVR